MDVAVERFNANAAAVSVREIMNEHMSASVSTSKYTPRPTIAPSATAQRTEVSARGVPGGPLPRDEEEAEEEEERGNEGRGVKRTRKVPRLFEDAYHLSAPAPRTSTSTRIRNTAHSANGGSSTTAHGIIFFNERNHGHDNDNVTRHNGNNGTGSDHSSPFRVPTATTTVLICDGCDGEFFLEALDLGLPEGEVPEGDWFCHLCERDHSPLLLQRQPMREQRHRRAKRKEEEEEEEEKHSIVFHHGSAGGAAGDDVAADSGGDAAAAGGMSQSRNGHQRKAGQRNTSEKVHGTVTNVGMTQITEAIQVHIL